MSYLAKEHEKYLYWQVGNMCTLQKHILRHEHNTKKLLICLFADVFHVFQLYCISKVHIPLLLSFLILDQSWLHKMCIETRVEHWLKKKQGKYSDGFRWYWEREDECFSGWIVLKWFCFTTRRKLKMNMLQTLIKTASIFLYSDSFRLLLGR